MAAVKATYTVSEIGTPFADEDGVTEDGATTLVVLYPVGAEAAPHDAFTIGDDHVILHVRPNAVEQLAVGDTVEVSLSFSVLDSPAAEAAKEAQDAE